MRPFQFLWFRLTRGTRWNWDTLELENIGRGKYQKWEAPGHGGDVAGRFNSRSRSCGQWGGATVRSCQGLDSPALF